MKKWLILLCLGNLFLTGCTLSLDPNDWPRGMHQWSKNRYEKAMADCRGAVEDNIIFRAFDYEEEGLTKFCGCSVGEVEGIVPFALIQDVDKKGAGHPRHQIIQRTTAMAYMLCAERLSQEEDSGFQRSESQGSSSSENYESYDPADYGDKNYEGLN
jgi:hypothetical protein